MSTVLAATGRSGMALEPPPDPSPTNSGSRRGGLAGVQATCEQTLAGQALISAVILVILLIGVAWNSPEGPIVKMARMALTPVAESSGLDQYWNMFAPNPPQRLEMLTVTVITAHGVERVWTPEHGNVVDQFSWYHWQKLKEHAVLKPRVRRNIAHWLVGRLTTPAERPARVVMTLHIQPLSAPDASDHKSPSNEVIYDEIIGGSP